MRTMLNGVRPLRSLALVVLIAALGCHAQTASSGPEPVQAGVKLSPAMARRVELTIRNKAQISPDFTITVSEPAKSEIPGYAQISVTFASEGKSGRAAVFLISSDGKTLAQFNKFDLSQSIVDSISTAGRPARGGPPDAPVTIVGFDDLECPFCGQMNAEIFPAVLNRYKNQVRVVYRDFPLEELHPWAKHAAIDANCVAAQSTSGYWNFVDHVHAHAAEMAGAEKTVEKASQSLDKIALDEGIRQKVNQAQLVACVLKQDDTSVKASETAAEGDPLRLDQAPVLYVNGEKVEGVVPIDTLYRIIDRALVAAGQTPPPYAAPAASAPAPVSPAPTKPGS
ncbi:MAG: DsbA family protein [Acidobacteriota bacterium]|nr:DsbA family protein [Acidobacteriota bacterium]